ncbi:hypothetical protein ACFFSW_17950 [Saccharothrix longispora]|uniref:Transcriptional regulator n=1 Tax=Saccharothrix longispora TaxID=33920 RepID=A0ABU1PSB9_9PSEU|nr:hypothetical protein [Saccharothrix longispora]MDR6593537.1 hypothetical protein [Saccharothrix longispora]
MTPPSWGEHVPPGVRELFHDRARKAALHLMALQDHDRLPVPEAARATLAHIDYCAGILDKLAMTACLAARQAGVALGEIASWLGIDEAALRERLAAHGTGPAAPPCGPRRPRRQEPTED